MKTAKVGCYWGRFNPPHKGHLRLIKKILNEVDKLIIVIGSAQEKNTKRNPFDGKERKNMIEAYLKEFKLDTKRIKVMSIKDGKSYMGSFKKLIYLAGKFDIVYSDKESVIKAVGTKYKIRKIIRKGKISATKIRDAIAHNKLWKNLTGKSVAKIIEKIDGVKRIKRAYNLG